MKGVSLTLLKKISFLTIILFCSILSGQDYLVEKVIRVYDGDTFYANLTGVDSLFGSNIGIRLKGIDTPEIRGSSPCVKERAIEARNFVKNLLSEADSVVLKNCSRDKYFRILAEVYVDGVNLSELLKNSGYAKKYDGGTKIKWKCVE